MIFALKTMKTLKVISEFQKLSLSERGWLQNRLVKMSFVCVGIKNHFHMNGCALRLALKQNIGATLRWPIQHMERT